MEFSFFIYATSYNYFFVFIVSTTDFFPSAKIDALGEVVRAVEGRVEVYMDGGVRRGTDVLKALAMGARAVFIGRPVLWGLAYKGQEGVERVLKILREELKCAMMLSGVAIIN